MRICCHVIFLFLMCLLFQGGFWTAHAAASQSREETSEAKASTEYQRINDWYEANKQTGGTYRLQEDLIVDEDPLQIISRGKPITIDTGSHSIIIKNGSWMNLGAWPPQAGGQSKYETLPVKVTGRGGSAGLIQLQGEGSRLFLDYTELQASQGTAISAKGSGEVHLDNDCLVQAAGGNSLFLQEQAEFLISDKNIELRSVGASALRLKDEAVLDWSYQRDSCLIEAVGQGAAAIESRVANLFVKNVHLRAEGKNSRGIYSKGNVELEQVRIGISGEGSCQVYLDGEDLKLTQDEYQNITPQYPEVPAPNDYEGDRGGGGTGAVDRHPNTPPEVQQETSSSKTRSEHSDAELTKGQNLNHGSQGNGTPGLQAQAPVNGDSKVLLPGQAAKPGADSQTRTAVKEHKTITVFIWVLAAAGIVAIGAGMLQKRRSKHNGKGR